jgi:Flp pilus assembly protein TadG
VTRTTASSRGRSSACPIVQWRRDQHGMVTAEAALVLPIVAAFAMAMIFLMSIALTKVSTVDAARDAARALARGEEETSAVDQAMATAPRGAQIGIEQGADTVTVTVRAETRSPEWLLLPMPPVTIESTSTVTLESDVAAD